MAPDPAPPPVILAIPAPPPPPNSSSLSFNPDPSTIASDQSLSPSVSACPSPVLAPPPPVPSGSAPASSASPASQFLCGDLSRRDLPADLLCFQSLLPPSSSVEPPSGHQLPAAPEPPSAAPEPPPAAPPASADSSAIPPLFSSLLHPPADAHLAAHPAVLQLHPHPVRRNASLSSVTEPPPAVPSETAALPSSAFPPLPSTLPKRPHQADAPLPAHPTDLQHRTPPVRHNAQVNPLLPKSYAQVAKGSLGPGFVRAHARDVESFARLPRTGINVICGSHEGFPACSFVQSDLPKVEGLYAKALVMRFLGGRPSLAASHKEISSWGFESPFSIGPLTSRSFLLRFQNERDLLKTITRPSSTLLTFPYKIFRWHNRCHIKEDSCMVPIWISLPRLPLQCFAPEFLESFASLIGRFLCLDKATATLARPSEARMCIEIDLREERPQFIWIGLFEGFKQPIVYERVPKFCLGCHVQGHTNIECSKTPLDTPQPQDSGPSPAHQEHSQPVRSYAEENLSAVVQVNPHQSRASSVAATATLLSASNPSQQDPPDTSHQQFLPPTISPAVISLEQQLSGPGSSAQPPLPPYQPPSHPGFVANALILHTPQPPLQQSGVSGVLAVQQSGVSEELHPPSPHSSSSAKAPPSAAPFPAAAVPPFTSDPPPPSAPPPPPEVQPVVFWTAPVSAAVQSPSLSALAAPFCLSDPVHSVQQSSTNTNQPSTSSLRVQSNFEKYNIRCEMPPESHPNRVFWERLNRSIGEQNGGIYALMNAPPPSKFRQNHLLEGLESEGSFETDSQQNSPVESSHEYVNKSLPLQCASEGEHLDEEPPGFQGHISDVAFYQRPMSSKKNKRQPDGPLRVQLRTRKGPSKHN